MKNGQGRRIEILFPQEGRTVAVDLDEEDDAGDVAELLVDAVDRDDPEDAERQLGEGLEGRARVRRLP